MVTEEHPSIPIQRVSCRVVASLSLLLLLLRLGLEGETERGAILSFSSLIFHWYLIAMTTITRRRTQGRTLPAIMTEKIWPKPIRLVVPALVLLLGMIRGGTVVAVGTHKPSSSLTSLALRDTKTTTGLHHFSTAATATITHAINTTYTRDAGRTTTERYLQDNDDLSRPPPVDTVRYVPWDRLPTEIQRIVSTGGLDYTERTWDRPGRHVIESRAFRNLLENQQNQIRRQLGLSMSQWDCYINHYTNFTWIELETARPDRQLQRAWSRLGWTEAKWTGADREPPASEYSSFTRLSLEQQQAAITLCYRAETWDEEDLRRWGYSWRAISIVEDIPLSSRSPTRVPTPVPTLRPTTAPTRIMTTSPPTPSPTRRPTRHPTKHPSSVEHITSHPHTHGQHTPLPDIKPTVSPTTTFIEDQLDKDTDGIIPTPSPLEFSNELHHGVSLPRWTILWSTTQSDSNSQQQPEQRGNSRSSSSSSWFSDEQQHNAFKDVLVEYLLKILQGPNHTSDDLPSEGTAGDSSFLFHRLSAQVFVQPGRAILTGQAFYFSTSGQGRLPEQHSFQAPTTEDLQEEMITHFTRVGAIPLVMQLNSTMVASNGNRSVSSPITSFQLWIGEDDINTSPPTASWNTTSHPDTTTSSSTSSSTATEMGRTSATSTTADNSSAVIVVWTVIVVAASVIVTVTVGATIFILIRRRRRPLQDRHGILRVGSPDGIVIEGGDPSTDTTTMTATGFVGTGRHSQNKPTHMSMFPPNASSLLNPMLGGGNLLLSTNYSIAEGSVDTSLYTSA